MVRNEEGEYVCFPLQQIYFQKIEDLSFSRIMCSYRVGCTVLNYFEGLNRCCDHVRKRPKP